MTLAMPSSEKTQDTVTIRMMEAGDLEALQRLSPPEVKPVIEFFVYPTLVAVVDGEIAGYTQFCFQPDKTFHSMAIRIGAKWKGHGIGRQLADARLDLGRRAGALMHFAAVEKTGETAMKTILERQGLHRCQERDTFYLYVGTF